MIITPKIYYITCGLVWLCFTLFFFRKELFGGKKRHKAITPASSGTPAAAPDDIIGRPQTLLSSDTSPVPPRTVQPVSPPASTPTDTEEPDNDDELDIEYEYAPADLEALQTAADTVPGVELASALGEMTSFDELDRRIADLHAQTDDEARELLSGQATSFKQLSLAFDTVASPYRSLDDDRTAGATIKDISRTDMFDQLYRANMRRVDEVLNSVRCKVVHLEDGELDVQATEEPDTSAIEDFIS